MSLGEVGSLWTVATVNGQPLAIVCAATQAEVNPIVRTCVANGRLRSDHLTNHFVRPASPDEIDQFESSGIVQKTGEMLVLPAGATG